MQKIFGNVERNCRKHGPQLTTQSIITRKIYLLKT